MEEKNKKELIELVKSLQKEKQDLEKAYIELDLECRDLRTENEELKSNKFASWKLKFFNLKDELKKELAEHEEFTKKAKAEIERLTEEVKKIKEMTAEQVVESEKLKQSCLEAVNSFIRMETLYKVKCQEIEIANKKLEELKSGKID